MVEFQSGIRIEITDIVSLSSSHTLKTFEQFTQPILSWLPEVMRTPSYLTATTTMMKEPEATNLRGSNSSTNLLISEVAKNGEHASRKFSYCLGPRNSSLPGSLFPDLAFNYDVGTGSSIIFSCLGNP